MENTIDDISISYENIRISPYKFIQLNDLRITQRINDHGRVSFTGVVNEEEGRNYVEMTNKQTEIEINLSIDGGSVKNLFRGSVTKIKVKNVRDIHYLEVEGISHTYEMDIKIKNRSFQKIDMPYAELVKKVVADYPKADFIDMVSGGRSPKRFILQYDETDWEFVKRMASRFLTVLVPDIKSKTPRFWFGIPKGAEKGAIEDFHYTTGKRLSSYRECVNNNSKDIKEEDFISYDVESKKLLQIGDQVHFKGRKHFVMEWEMVMEKGIVKNNYTIAIKEGLNRPPFLNKKIKGMALEGKVIDRKADNIKIHLKIDYQQKKEEACYFPYASFYTSQGHTGWYCIPEIGDRVKLYFPSEKEEHAVAVNSIRKRTVGGDKILNPDVKIFRTKFGKEIIFSKDEIAITGKDGQELILVNEKRGIVILSMKDIRVIAKDNLTIDASNNIKISAKDEIKFACKESTLNMNGVTTLKGTNIKTN